MRYDIIRIISCYPSEYCATKEPARLSVARNRNWGLVREKREEDRTGEWREEGGGFSKKTNLVPWCRLEAPVEVIYLVIYACVVLCLVLL